MKPSEAFGVVVRSVGLLILLPAIWSLFWIALTCIVAHTAPNNIMALIINGILALFVGIWFLGGAPGLVSLAYPDKSERER
jgi:hypothetical protein